MKDINHEKTVYRSIIELQIVYAFDSIYVIVVE